MNNTPLCVGGWQKYHIFFILSSTDTQIFFYILAVANNAAITMWYMYLFELVFLFFGGKYPEVEFLDHIVVLFFIFVCVWKLHTIFKWLSQYRIPPMMHKEMVPFPPYHHKNVISCLFGNSHSKKYEMISHCGFDLHFHND